MAEQTKPRLSVTIAEAAKMTGLSARFLYERKAAGDFEVIYLGTRRYVIDWDSFNQWWKQLPREAPDP